MALYSCIVWYVKAIPLQAWTGPYSSRRLRLPEILDNWHMEVITFSALNAGHL